MFKLYVSTDSTELKTLIGNNPKYLFRDYPVETGEKLIPQIGFNPMSQVEISDKDNVETIISKLVENDLFVSVDNGKEVSMHKSQDYDLKTRLLETTYHKNYPFSDCVFRYSINPNVIDKDHGVPKKDNNNWLRPWILGF